LKNPMNFKEQLANQRAEFNPNPHWADWVLGPVEFAGMCAPTNHSSVHRANSAIHRASRKTAKNLAEQTAQLRYLEQVNQALRLELAHLRRMRFG
ncbi:MAG: hypothetical protein ACYC3N_09830, partial [Halothiobacillus sp.]